MYSRLRKRGASEEEEGGVSTISSNVIEVDHLPQHNFQNGSTNNNNNNSITRILARYGQNKHRTGSANSLDSVKSNRPPSRSSSRGSKCYILVGLVTIFVLLSVIGYSIFAILHVALRSRPAWLYGQPVLMKDVASCLVDDHHPPPPRVLWEWHNYTISTTTTNASSSSHQRQQQQQQQQEGPIRLLVAQYSGFGAYAQFLNYISPVHQEYAKQHGYDYVILQGTLLDFEGIQQDCFSNLRATFDKIPLLEMAYSLKHKYDYVLVLDTDAMIVDHTQWLDLLPSNQLLAAQRVMRFDLSNTWDINAGVTLWNLHHKDFSSVVKRWKSLSQYGSTSAEPNPDKLRMHLKQILTKNDDQYFLQTALLDAYTSWNRPVVAVNDEFNYYDGTLVKHFKRDKRSWSTSGLQQRLERVREAIRELCSSQQQQQNDISYCLTPESKSGIDYSKREPPSGTTLV